MTNAKFFFSLILFISMIQNGYTLDLSQVVSGSDVEDTLGQMKSEEPSAYISHEHDLGEVNQLKVESDKQPDFMFNQSNSEVSIKDDPRRKYQDFSYTAPGVNTPSENYIELDKYEMAHDFRKHSSGAFNIAYLKNSYQYDSPQDVINQTIGTGYRHVKGGAIYLRNDQYFFRSFMLNTFWSLGAGVGYNSGRGLFVTGERSDTTFKLWEVPVDAGIGFEIPIFHWFKITGVAGPSVMGLYQNRDDFQNGEKGKNKTQVSIGQFAAAQFKINLSGFSSDFAYELFTNSKITNLTLNLETRYQSYQKFQDAIKISGTSFGFGFSFEYL